MQLQNVLYIRFAPSGEVGFRADLWVWAGWVGSRESTVAYSGTDVGTKMYIIYRNTIIMQLCYIYAYLYMYLMCSYKMLYIAGLHIPFWEVEFGGDVWGWVSSRESTVAYSAMDVGTKVYIYRNTII